MHQAESAPWRALWNYGDPVASEGRLRAALAEASGFAALELETQVARALGLQRRFEEARAVLEQVERRFELDDRARSKLESQTHTAIAAARVEVMLALEQGRVERSSGHVEASPVHFERAFQRATAEGLDFLAIDAAHMLGIVSSPEEARAWNTRAITIALESPDPLARGWAAVSLNNQGWNEFEAGRPTEALDLLERALVLRRERPDQVEPLWIARWSVARIQRALGRVDEALAEQQALHAERAAAQSPDGYVCEELGECYLTLGRPLDARPWFEHASQLLAADSWLAANEPARLARLARLAAGGTAD